MHMFYYEYLISSDDKCKVASKLFLANYLKLYFGYLVLPGNHLAFFVKDTLVTVFKKRHSEG